jgi:ABC-2 type transport system ATP-binding protein
MIKIRNLTKNFNGFKAVDNISFEVKSGEIFGLLGPNGAGKTTTIRIITGILKPTEGLVKIGQFNIEKNPLEARQLMGIVPEAANAYLDISTLDNLLLMGGLYGFNKSKCREKADELLKLFELFEHRHKKVKYLSKGMKQREIIAMALMNDAKLLLLDEPTSGLDVESSRLIRKLICKLNQEGTTILLTTHNLNEANALCDRIAIMNDGKFAAIDRPERLKLSVKKATSIEVAFRDKLSKDELEFSGVHRVEKVGDRYRLYTEKPADIFPALIKFSEKRNNRIVLLNSLEPSLEDVFVELTKKN